MIAEFHVASSGDPISIDSSFVERVSLGLVPGTTCIALQSCGSVDVKEAYAAVRAALGWDRPQKLEK